MTTLRRRTAKCSVCGETSMHTVMLSSNSFGGGPDLDLRPALMIRNTMRAWIQRCPHCGYCAPKISDESGISSEFLESEKYLSCNGLQFRSELAKTFFRYHLICLELNAPEKALKPALEAAWVCDDRYDAVNAVLCRLACLSCMKPATEETDMNVLLKRADIMRRAGLFDAVIRLYSEVKAEEPLHQQIIDFHILKSKEKDADCYTVKEAVAFMENKNQPAE